MICRQLAIPQGVSLVLDPFYDVTNAIEDFAIDAPTRGRGPDRCTRTN
jgi:hypothetical protein